MHFNVAQREIILKVVYYGPPLSGKTTNLQAVHRLVAPERAGRLTVLDTADERTLFFDLLPVMLPLEDGYSLKLKLFTVPGQVVHAATRKIVLAGADGVVFVADSQRAHANANSAYWQDMRRYLRESGLDPDHVPTVVQFNKRDLPDIRTDDELVTLQERSKQPIYKAVAVTNDGVLETLRGLLELVFESLNKRYDFEHKFKVSSTHLFESLVSPNPPTREVTP